MGVLVVVYAASSTLLVVCHSRLSGDRQQQPAASLVVVMSPSMPLSTVFRGAATSRWSGPERVILLFQIHPVMLPVAAATAGHAGSSGQVEVQARVTLKLCRLATAGVPPLCCCVPGCGWHWLASSVRVSPHSVHRRLLTKEASRSSRCTLLYPCYTQNRQRQAVVESCQAGSATSLHLAHYVEEATLPSCPARLSALQKEPRPLWVQAADPSKVDV